MGRDFTEADAIPQPARPEVLIPPGSAAILSYEYWQRRYAGSTTVLGQEIPGSGPRGPRIVGVLAPGFQLFFPPGARVDAAPDFWVANNIGYDAAHRNLLTVGAIGRLKSGVTLRRAQDQLDALAPELRKNSFDPAAALRLEPMHQYLVEEVRPAILALMGAVIFLLLIACANVANLLLVRASLRERELAMRAALGGSWGRLLSQMLAEAMLLSAMGTLLGVVFAWLGIHLLLGLAPATLPRIESSAIDWRVLTFAAMAGLAAVAIFGVIPALRAAGPDVNQILRGGRTAGLRAGRRLRNAVVIAEVGLSFVLLVGSGLMFRSFLELRRIDPGYRPQGLLTFFVTREWQLTRQQGRLALLREIRQRLGRLPGIENVAGDPAKYAAAVRAEVAKVDRTLVISKMQPMEALVDRDQAGTRFSLLLIGIFAAIAVLLAGVGLYGVLATVVRQRTAEIGVRMALGADPAGIFCVRNERPRTFYPFGTTGTNGQVIY